MWKYGLAILLILTTPGLSGQDLSSRKADSVCRLVRNYFNAKDATGLYALTGAQFRKVITLEKFREISRDNLFPLGPMPEPEFMKWTKGARKYKVDFATATLALYLSLDSTDKIETLLLTEYTAEPGERSTAPTNNPLRSALDHKVDDAIQSYMKKAAASGLSIGILKEGRMQVYGYGTVSRNSKRIPDAHTLYEVGSITKTFTATLLARAVREGRIRLEDPAHLFLPPTVPPLVYGGVPVTIGMLANHSSGLPRMPDNFLTTVTDTLNPYRNYSRSHLLRYLSTVQLQRVPGTVYEYSNLGFAILGLILENIYGKPYEQLVTDFICSPIGLTETRQLLRKKDSARFAPGYNEEGRYNGQWDLQAFAPAGGLRSSVADLLRYAQAQLGGAPPALQKDIALTHRISFSDGTNKTALAWHFKQPGTDEILFHNGATGGYRSYIGINLKKNYAVVVLANTALPIDEIGNELMRWLEKDYQ